MTFESTDQALSIATLELQYESTIFGFDHLILTCNNLVSHPKSKLSLTGGGNLAEEGLGAGRICSASSQNLTHPLKSAQM